MRRNVLCGLVVVLVVVGGAAALRSVTDAHGRLGGIAVGSGGTVHASALAPGTPIASEEQYVAMQMPCRLADTRLAGGLIAADATRNFHVRGSGGISAQGGQRGGCGIPQSADAIYAAVSLTGETADGYLRIWPFGTVEPSPPTVRFVRGVAVTDTSMLTVGRGASALSVRPHSGGTHFVLDVLGYTVPPIAVRVSIDGTITMGTRRVLGVTHTGTGGYDVTIDRDVSKCVGIANASPAEASAFANGSPPDVMHVQTQRFTAINSLVFADEPFDLQVMC